MQRTPIPLVQALPRLITTPATPTPAVETPPSVSLAAFSPATTPDEHKVETDDVRQRRVSILTERESIDVDALLAHIGSAIVSGGVRLERVDAFQGRADLLVVFDNKEDARAVVAALHNQAFAGQTLDVAIDQDEGGDVPAATGVPMAVEAEASLTNGHSEPAEPAEPAEPEVTPKKSKKDKKKETKARSTTPRKPAKEMLSRKVFDPPSAEEMKWLEAARKQRKEMGLSWDDYARSVYSKGPLKNLAKLNGCDRIGTESLKLIQLMIQAQVQAQLRRQVVIAGYQHENVHYDPQTGKPSALRIKEKHVREAQRCERPLDMIGEPVNTPRGLISKVLARNKRQKKDTVAVSEEDDAETSDASEEAEEQSGDDDAFEPEDDDDEEDDEEDEGSASGSASDSASDSASGSESDESEPRRKRKRGESSSSSSSSSEKKNKATKSRTPKTAAPRKKKTAQQIKEQRRREDDDENGQETAKRSKPSSRGPHKRAKIASK